MKVKAIVMAALATMAIAASVSAAVPSGYDGFVTSKKVTDWRKSSYNTMTKSTMTAVNVEKVTPLEIRTDGYNHEYVTIGTTDEGTEVRATPNQAGITLTEADLDEMFRGN